MTRKDQELDLKELSRRAPLVLYRLCRAEYANLTGQGAARYGGRWNRIGEGAIYTSADMATPVLELLAHTAKDTIPGNLAMMTIHLSGSWSEGSAPGPKFGSGQKKAYTSLNQAQKHLTYDLSLPFAAAVPSVILPVWNVVLFPERPGFFQHVSLQSVQPFSLDPRLFPEDAIAEP